MTTALLLADILCRTEAWMKMAVVRVLVIVSEHVSVCGEMFALTPS